MRNTTKELEEAKVLKESNSFNKLCDGNDTKSIVEFALEG